MNVGQMISVIKNRLQFRQDNLDADIQLELSLTQERLERGPFMPWFLLEEGAEATCLADEPRLKTPSDFLMEYEGSGLAGALQIEADPADTTNTWLFLRKGDHGDLLERYPGTGKPYGYDLSGDYFRLYPTPGQTYRFRMFYYAKDASIASAASTSTNKWLTDASDWLLQETLIVIAGDYLANQRAMTKAMRSAAIAKALLVEHSIAREEQNKRTIFGGVTG